MMSVCTWTNSGTRMCSMFASDPVSKLSTQMTRCPRRRSSSHRCEPRNPAPPVTRQVAMRRRSLESRAVDDRISALLQGRNFAHLATVLPDGSPHSVAVWIGLEGERVVFFTQPSSRKARNLAADPRVAISIIDLAAPYRTAYLRGEVVSTREGDEALEVIDRLAVKYTGEPFPMRSG